MQLEGQYSEVRIQARAEIHQANWKRQGDRLLASLTRRSSRVVLAIDELPILVSRILAGRDYKMRPERVEVADEFRSWLRRNAQIHRGRLCLIVSGSVGIVTIVRRAGLTSKLNVFTVLELKPWSHATASACLGALARTYGIYLPTEIRHAICMQLRSCISHHVQQFFDAVNERMTVTGRDMATLDDADAAYRKHMLGARSQIHVDQYFERLKAVLGDDGYTVARELLALAVGNSSLSQERISQYEAELKARTSESDTIPFVLDVLEHDSYFGRNEDGLIFTSGLLEDWLRIRRGAPDRAPCQALVCLGL